MPYCVGTKKVFVVTWLTNTNLQLGCEGKFPSLPELEGAAVVLLHAASSEETLPNAAPARSVRRLSCPLARRCEKLSSFIWTILQSHNYVVKTQKNDEESIKDH